MKKLVGYFLLLTFVISNTVYAQQSFPNYKWTDDAGGTANGIVTTTYEVNGNSSNGNSGSAVAVDVCIDPEKKKLEQKKNQEKHNKTMDKLRAKDVDLEQRMKSVVDILLYDVDQNKNNLTDKMTALGTLDIVFSNNILSKEQEVDLVLNRIFSSIGVGGVTEAWACTVLGLVVNYYPAAWQKNSSVSQYYPSWQKNLSADQNFRDPKYRDKILRIFDWIDDETVDIELRMNLAEAVGLIKGSAESISIYIENISKSLSNYSYYEKTNNSALIFSLARALAYQASVYNDERAEQILKNYYYDIYSSDIDSRKKMVISYPITVIVNAAMAAGSYGIESSYVPLQFFSMWGNRDNIFDVGGIKMIPLDIRRMCFDILPASEKDKLKKEYPDGIETVFEEVDGKTVAVDRPIYTDAEQARYEIESTCNSLLELVLTALTFEMGGAVMMRLAYGTEFAIANSVFAEAVAYRIASTGGRSTVAAYEMSLMLNSARYTIAFAETPIGMMSKRIGDGIRSLLIKLSPQISLLKNGFLTNLLLVNMNLAPLTTKAVPNVVNASKPAVELAMSTAEKEALQTAKDVFKTYTDDIIETTDDAFFSLLEKKGLNPAESQEIINTLKPQSPIKEAPIPENIVNQDLVKTVFIFVQDGVDKYLIIEDRIPSFNDENEDRKEYTHKKTFKYEDGKPKYHSSLGGGGEPPLSLSAEASAELDRLIEEYNRLCKEFKA